MKVHTTFKNTLISIFISVFILSVVGTVFGEVTLPPSPPTSFFLTLTKDKYSFIFYPYEISQNSPKLAGYEWDAEEQRFIKSESLMNGYLKPWYAYAISPKEEITLELSGKLVKEVPVAVKGYDLSGFPIDKPTLINEILIEDVPFVLPESFVPKQIPLKDGLGLYYSVIYEFDVDEQRFVKVDVKDEKKIVEPGVSYFIKVLKPFVLKTKQKKEEITDTLFEGDGRTYTIKGQTFDINVLAISDCGVDGKTPEVIYSINKGFTTIGLEGSMHWLTQKVELNWDKVTINKGADDTVTFTLRGTSVKPLPLSTGAAVKSRITGKAYSILRYQVKEELSTKQVVPSKPELPQPQAPSLVPLETTEKTFAWTDLHEGTSGTYTVGGKEYKVLVTKLTDCSKNERTAEVVINEELIKLDQWKSKSATLKDGAIFNIDKVVRNEAGESNGRGFLMATLRKPFCKEGETKCDGKKLLTCKFGKLEETVCQRGCTTVLPQPCVPSPSDKPCPPSIPYSKCTERPQPKGDVMDELKEGQTKAYTVKGLSYSVTPTSIKLPDEKGGALVTFRLDNEISTPRGEEQTAVFKDGSYIEVGEIMRNPVGLNSVTFGLTGGKKLDCGKGSQKVTRIVLRDRVNPTDWVLGGNIVLSPDKSIGFKNLNNYGAPMSIAIPDKPMISEFKVTINNYYSESQNVGFNEVSVYTEDMVGKEKQILGLSCTAGSQYSSGYSCNKALNGDPGEWANKGNNNAYITIFLPVADGTVCGDKKKCMAGRCVSG